jgi:hypothetical protein
MDASEPGEDPQVQRSQSYIALGKRPVDDSPHHNISNSAGTDVLDDDSEGCVQKAIEIQALRYDALHSPNIRLVTIDPAMQDGKLKLTMKQVPLINGLDFHVLSYVWGDPTNKKTVTVNGQRLDVTENLHDFLETTHQNGRKFLTHHENLDYRKLYTTEPAQTAAESSEGKVTGATTMPMQFWIDAICINQDDLQERNEQVPRMGDIYSMASRVWIWIGKPSKIFNGNPDLAPLRRALNHLVQESFKQPASHETMRPPEIPLTEHFADHHRQVMLERSRSIMQAMRIVLEPGPMTDMISQHNARASKLASSQHTHAFFNKFLRQLTGILSQPYFKRVWIIQEYVLNHREPIALLGDFVLDLQHMFVAALRISRETQTMSEQSKGLAFAAIGQATHLMHLHEVRMDWHGFPRANKPHGRLTRLSPGERLDYCLQTFANTQCTNPVDRFYGILGFLSHYDLPRSLLPDYSLPVEEVSQAYTRYIIESTGNLQIIESSMGHESADCPSWVAHAQSLTGRDSTKTTVSKGNKPHCFSEDGRRLTLEGTFLAEIVKCSCTDCPNETMGEHLKYLDDELFEKASQITGKPKSEIFKSWLNTQLDVHTMFPSSFRDFDSMQDILRRYQAVCEGIPLEALDGLNRMSIAQKHIIFQTPCRDPGFLYAVFRLADPRFCVLSTGDIVMCLLKHTNTNRMSRTHAKDDSAWALKGLYLPAILRPKGEGYEYCGPMVSSRTFVEVTGTDREKDDLFLDDDFFAARKVQPVTLV